MKVKYGTAARQFVTSRGVYHRAPGKPIEPKAVDLNIDREGYTPCPTCGRWVRTRADGALYAHRTLNKTRIPCVTGGPAFSERALSTQAWL